MMRIIRWTVVTMGTLALTTLGINAFDNIDTFERSLLGALFMAGESGPCPDDMSFVSTSGGGFCIDSFEAAAGETCVYTEPSNKVETDENLASSACAAVSVAGAMPWRHITRHQAELACARSGKRLPASQEWYRAALGTPDRNAGWGNDDCNVDNRSNSPSPTGSRSACVSPIGAYDMIGNVWEWVEETAFDGVFEDAVLPEEGYVTDIGSEGIAVRTDFGTPEASFFNDYFWVATEGTRGIIRGGYWNSRADAGQYAVNIAIPPSFIGNAVGFRCVKEAAR